jgi:hypothetical protein
LDRCRYRSPGASGVADSPGCETPGLRRLRWPFWVFNLQPRPPRVKYGRYPNSGVIPIRTSGTLN